MIEKIQERIAELTKAIEQTVAQHNFLTGALQEANQLLQFYIAHRDEINKIASEATENPMMAVMDSLELPINDNNDGTVPVQ
jgi:molecular chaperone GrpE (heat shock protein)